MNGAPLDVPHGEAARLLGVCSSIKAILAECDYAVPLSRWQVFQYEPSLSLCAISRVPHLCIRHDDDIVASSNIDHATLHHHRHCHCLCCVICLFNNAASIHYSFVSLVKMRPRRRERDVSGCPRLLINPSRLTIIVLFTPLSASCYVQPLFYYHTFYIYKHSFQNYGVIYRHLEGFYAIVLMI